MTQEIQRVFDTGLKAVVVTLRDGFGNDSVHTVYVTGAVDVNAEIARIKAELDASTETAMANMRAAGWQG